jgi:hypothetical protein
MYGGTLKKHGNQARRLSDNGRISNHFWVDNRQPMQDDETHHRPSLVSLLE